MQNLFKATYKETIHHFVRSARLNKACDLLKQSQSSIAFIASECGYTNPSKFSAFFKAEKHMSPKSYRNHYQ
ncbi:helix-turn-helix domain-containing protein [Convivina intestini]|uniref:helix-turn-helix domain-containing protein n=1 Tax=Convivina intestini TaxID=1505726 RepID=UPI00200CA522|nr:helix-turn-helix domain-containing protein [Convivina intestini]